MVEIVRGRKMPIVGNGAGVWSWLHVDDAAAATIVAVEGSQRGIFNIVDDEPAAVAEWLPYLAEAVGAKRPMRVPAWLGKIRDRGRGRTDDDRGAGLVERKGEARAGLASDLEQLA